MSDIDTLIGMVADVAKLRGMYDQLEKERDALREENKTLKIECNRFEGECLEALKELSHMTIERDRCKEALKRCIGWMEPVMDGFKIPPDAEARKEVLEFAKSALQPTETR